MSPNWPSRRHSHSSLIPESDGLEPGWIKTQSLIQKLIQQVKNRKLENYYATEWKNCYTSMGGNRWSSKNNKQRHEFGLGMWAYTINHRVMKVKVTLQSDVWLHLVQARWLSFKSEKERVSRSMCVTSVPLMPYTDAAWIQCLTSRLMYGNCTYNTDTNIHEHAAPPLFLSSHVSTRSSVSCKTHSDTNQTGFRSEGSDLQQPLHELPILSPRLPSRSGRRRPRLASLVSGPSGAVRGTPREPVYVLFGWPGTFM